MTEYAINTTSLTAIRSEANEMSTMTSQLLFGEHCKVLDEIDNWYKIQNIANEHYGWVAKSNLLELNKEEVSKLEDQPLIRVCMPIADVFCMTDKTIYKLPMGSVIRNYDESTSKFELDSKVYQIHPSFITYLPGFNRDGIVPTAMSLINTPQLAGGKSLMGMDAIGFVQTVLTVNGLSVALDGGNRMRVGTQIDISDLTAGDILFFKNKQSEQVHVAIYVAANKIIHMDRRVQFAEHPIIANMVLIVNNQEFDLIDIRQVS